jgi:hypothetical protein
MQTLNPKEIRKLGILLNNGRIHGWKINLATIMSISIETVSSWMAENEKQRKPSDMAQRFLSLCSHMHCQGVNVRALVDHSQDCFEKNLKIIKGG